jgi:hypothetical protein
MRPSLMSARLRNPTTLANSKRTFAVASSAVEYNRKGEQPKLAPTAVKTVSKASSGVSVATHDGRGPVSSLAIVIAAGSRNDSVDAPGVAHFLKNTLVRVSNGGWDM